MAFNRLRTVGSRLSKGRASETDHASLSAAEMNMDKETEKHELGSRMPLVFLEAIQYFAHTGDIGCLLAPQRMLLGIHNVNGDTALHTALLAGKTEAALSFVRVMTAEDLDIQNSEGLTALVLAAIHGNAAVAEALVKRGANVHATDEHGNTAVHLAGSIGVVRAVLRAASPADVERLLVARNDAGQCAVHMAASKGRLDMLLEFVVRHQCDPNIPDASHARTPLHHAVRGQSRASVELLLEYGADVNAADHDGNTPLHHAVQHDMYDIAKLLVDFGADCVADNHYFQTPLDLALHYGSVNAHAAIMATPALRVPSKNLRAVAAAVFPSAPTPSPVVVAPVPAPARPAARPSKQGSPLAKRSPEAARARAPAQAVHSSSAPPTAQSDQLPERTSKSSDDWLEIADDEVKTQGETEWHMGKKKSVSSVGQALKTFTRKIGKEKEKDQSSTSQSASQSQLRGAPSASSSAKAEKARLAQMYGTPEVVTTAAGPSSAKDEKKALERKYNLEVVDSQRRPSSDAATSKAAEVAAQAASNSSRNPSRTDELSTLD